MYDRPNCWFFSSCPPSSATTQYNKSTNLNSLKVCNKTTVNNCNHKKEQQENAGKKLHMHKTQMPTNDEIKGKSKDDEEEDVIMEEDIKKIKNHFKSATGIVVEEMEDTELIENPEHLFRKTNGKITGVRKAFSLGKKVVVTFDCEKNLNNFVHSPICSEIFGGKAKYTLTEQRTYDAFVLGINKKFYSPIVTNKQRFTNNFIEKQILEKIDDCIDVEISEGKNVLIKLIYDQKTAKITLRNEKVLADTLNRNFIRIGFEEYRICLPGYSKTKICMNCARLGHTQGNCRNEAACIKCAGSHRGDDCKARDEKCLNCNGKHRATSNKCRKTKNKRIAVRREQEERLLNKWNLKNGRLKGSMTPQMIVKELIEEEKSKLRKKVAKRLSTEMSKKIKLDVIRQFLFDENLYSP